jgi:Flp pilus assembly protein TadD
LPAETEDWVEITDKVAQFLVDAHDPDSACRLYEAVLKVLPDQQEFITGMGWVLCRAGKQAEALPWMGKALANAPQKSSVLNDYGWALTELGRYEEAEPLLVKAAQLASSDDPLPINNLKRLRQLRHQQRYGSRHFRD